MAACVNQRATMGALGGDVRPVDIWHVEVTHDDQALSEQTPPDHERYPTAMPIPSYSENVEGSEIGEQVSLKVFTVLSLEESSYI
ncbi:hypothetical protein RvY_02646 [Ramazzottius varieornatus]|uniref:Uncharacterized protein n=1 Tax=Ramazzottius varieornatus TaxID=947166 RepID=A0A1D1UKH6_RAMVA|nr:hypothetical protein RvY_02646 [Ramazzottius varieornatus]